MRDVPWRCPPSLWGGARCKGSGCTDTPGVPGAGNSSPHFGRWRGQSWTSPWCWRCCLVKSPPTGTMTLYPLVTSFVCKAREKQSIRNIRVRERHKPKIETKDTSQKTYWVKTKQRSGACIHLSSGAIQFKNKYLSIERIAKPCGNLVKFWLYKYNGLNKHS